MISTRTFTSGSTRSIRIRGWFHAEVTDVEGRLAREPDRALIDGGQGHVVLGGSSHTPEAQVAPDEEAALVCDGYYRREHAADGRVAHCVDSLVQFAIF
jgi:hypothetical protein